MLTLLGCDSSMTIPRKPDNVSASAVWSGGPDGGHWFDCENGGNKFRYKCVIFNDYNGEIITRGSFVLRKSIWNESIGRATYVETEAIESPQYNYYDGQLIHLKGSLVMLPDGVITHPFGDGHGKQQEYNLGEPVGEEKSY